MEVFLHCQQDNLHLKIFDHLGETLASPVTCFFDAEHSRLHCPSCSGPARLPSSPIFFIKSWALLLSETLSKLGHKHLKNWTDSKTSSHLYEILFAHSTLTLQYFLCLSDSLVGSSTTTSFSINNWPQSSLHPLPPLSEQSGHARGDSKRSFPLRHPLQTQLTRHDVKKSSKILLIIHQASWGHCHRS